MNRTAMFLLCGLLGTGTVVSAAEGVDVVTFKTGAFEVVADAPPKDMPLAMFSGAPDEKMKALAPEGTVKLWRSIFAFSRDGKKIVVDTGMGEKDSPFIQALSRGGETRHPDVILLTHLHGDHIGGLMDGDEARFPNAKVYMSKPALNSWKTATGDRAQQAQKILKAYDGRIAAFDDGEEVIAGVVAHYAPGHTPGHVVFETPDVLFVGDLLHAAAIQFALPDVCASFDMDKPVAVAQRKVWLKKAAASGKPIAGCHLPYIGKVTAQGEGFAFTEVK